MKDFAPITQIVYTPNLLAVPADLPVKSVAELVAYARAQPGKLTFGSAGVGTSQHLAGELFKTMAGIDIQHVPYRGIAAVMPDLLAGRITHGVRQYLGGAAAGARGQAARARRDVAAPLGRRCPICRP